MAIEITDEFMYLKVEGRVVSTARRREGGWWEATHWPRFFNRNQAVTALTLTELLATGRSEDDPLIVALREGLR
jgi:hypothetical protein